MHHRHSNKNNHLTKFVKENNIAETHHDDDNYGMKIYLPQVYVSIARTDQEQRPRWMRRECPCPDIVQCCRWIKKLIKTFLDPPTKAGCSCTSITRNTKGSTTCEILVGSHQGLCTSCSSTNPKLCTLLTPKAHTRRTICKNWDRLGLCPPITRPVSFSPDIFRFIFMEISIFPVEKYYPLN